MKEEKGDKNGRKKGFMKEINKGRSIGSRRNDR